MMMQDLRKRALLPQWTPLPNSWDQLMIHFRGPIRFRDGGLIFHHWALRV